MRATQKKKYDYAQKIRQTRRQEIRAEKRIWNELPSVILQIPARIQQSDWTYFEQLLDAIKQTDIEIVDQHLKKYLQTKYSQKVEKESQKKIWEDEDQFNILRIIVRLRIADQQQIRRLLDCSQKFHKDFLESNDQKSIENMFKSIKQIAVYLQSSETTLSSQNRDFLNVVVGDLKIYKKWFSSKTSQGQKLMDEYRVYYVFILAHKAIDFNIYLKHKNIGQLYCLIQDSVTHKQPIEIMQTVDVILKLLQLDPDRGEQVAFCLRGLEVLLIDGLEQAKVFTSNEENAKTSSVEYHFEGRFFSQLLKTLNRCDVYALIRIIELLAQLFQASDNYIEAAARVQNPQNNIEIEHKPQQSENVVELGRQTYKTYAQFFIFSINSILSEIRYKTYWLLSNILGSEKHFYSYGFQFLKLFYMEKKCIEEEEEKHIANELGICILNFTCNLHLEPEILTELLNVKYEAESNQKVQMEVQDLYPDNALMFCLQIALDSIESSHNMMELQTEVTPQAKQNIGTFLHRALYALFTIVEIAKQEKEQTILERVMFVAQNKNIPLCLEQINSHKTLKGAQWKDIESILEELLKVFESQSNSL